MSRIFETNQTVGEYRVVDFLGAGGMGEVYRAMHSKIGRIAAVKVLTQATQSSGFVERFFNEARIQASLQHPNIATLYDFCEVANQPCIIMEYVDGETISERISAYGALPLSETVYVFGKVVEAIDYIHSHGVIHRDIKSNNIKISSQGQVKLLDFGIAKGQTSQQLTQVGSVIGTLQYLAPELIRGGASDARGDIWALGVLLYEMVAGRVPFDADTIGDLCDRIDRVEYTAPAQVNSGVPREVASIIARCLKKNPAERYRTAGELLSDARKLSGVVSKPGLSPTVSEAATEYVEAKAASSKRLPLLIGAAAAVLVLAVVGIIALVVFNSSDAETGTQTNTPSTTNTAKALTASPSPAASHDASERTVEVSVSDGKADVYHGDEKVGTTPFAVRGKLGEHVTLTLKRDGYSDEPVDFVVGEKKAFMYTLAKK
ncbi:MAG: eukaryotic-like serine/threonine-protein kinase [Acidobacteriota bacterium]|jgi:serine/threonine-protein kinase|nr:eukaryotic-like serine/threonine-protein kinase [Acidobacteriota bacterium]MDT7780226.1 eukaryotic-like serine/threonine-protein kinase [Acidobacteriota bacterium]